MTIQGSSNDWRAKVISQAVALPPRVLIYAPPGTGKTTLAASAPRALIIDFDRGADQTSAARIAGPSSWSESLSLIRSISSDAHDYQTLVVDTVDPLEELASRHVCEEAKKKTLADFGYGAGYEALAAEWRLMLGALDGCRSRGMSIVLLGHSIVRQSNDPQLGGYDQFVPQLQKKTWAMTSRWCDVVGFANFDAARLEDERRAIVTGERMLWTTRGTGFEAKNRYGLPAKLPLSWPALAAGIRAGTQSAAEIRARITALAAGTEHEARAALFVADAGDDPRKLDAIEAALAAKISNQ